MRVLDLFCCAGGAATGLSCAGFDVVGVDIDPQPNYPFEFSQMDAIEALRVLRDGPIPGLPRFDLIWASPPCQHFIRSGLVDKSKTVDLLTPTRSLLQEIGIPYILENVPGAPMRPDVILCGSMFGLPVRRHRWFELSDPIAFLVPQCDHTDPVVGVYGHPHGERGAWPGMLPGSQDTWGEALGIDWMSAPELSQAIPPAYSEYLARAWLRSRG